MSMRIPVLMALAVGFALPCVWAQTPDAPPPPKPDDRFKADVLLVVAHPDDETAIGSYLAKLTLDDQKRVAVVYGNRGTGGGNTMGNEQSTAMGLVREIEGRSSTAVFGIRNVWFLDGTDSPGQDVLASLQRWKHGVVLEQLVRIVRLTRPDVIVTWLPHFVAGENHGDHQASGVIATEAFDMAGDPTVFPGQVAVPRERIDINQLNEGLHPWQPKKLYFFSDASHELAAPGPHFDVTGRSKLRNVPFYRLAIALDTFHLTQGDVALPAKKALESGRMEEYIKDRQKFHLIFGKSLVKCAPAGDLFDGIPGAAIPYARPAGYAPERLEGISLKLGGVFAFYRDFWRAHGIRNVAGIVQPEMEIAQGSYVHIPLQIENGTPDSIIVTLTPDLPEGWVLSSGAARYHVGPNEIYPVQTFIFAPGKPGEDFQNVSWRAEAGGKTLDAVTIRIKVSEWTLPE